MLTFKSSCNSLLQEFGDPVILRMNPLSTAALGYSLGYFSTDLVMLYAHYPDVSLWTLR